MKSRLRIVLFCLVVLATPAMASGTVAKDDPAWLRENHAGAESMTVQQPLAQIHDAIVTGVNACYGNRRNVRVARGIAGSIARRVVTRGVTEGIAADGKSGFVVYSVQGFWLTPVFLFELHATDTGVTIDFYYQNDNKLQRSAFSNAKAWLDGNTSVCTDAH